MTSEQRSLAILGPTQATLGDETLPLRPRERDVLAALALRSGSTLRSADIADALWAGGVPASASVTIQNHVSRLRRVVGRDAVLTEAGGYRLGPTWSIDADQRDVLAGQAIVWRRAARPDRAVEVLEQALALTRDESFADLAPSGLVVRERMRLVSIERSIEDDLLVALLLAGMASRAAIAAEALATAEPFREVRWAALSIALYRDDQRREAVRALQRGQEALRERVGLDAGPILERIESLVFDDDPMLLEASAAELLGRSEPGDALHLDAAGGSANEAAGIDELEASARVACDGLQFAEAAELFGAGAQLSSHDLGEDAPRTLGLRLDRVDALFLAGDPRCEAEVVDVVEVAQRVGGDVLVRAAGALCRLGPFAGPPSRNGEVAALIERAIDGAATPEARSAGHTEASLFYSLTGEVELATSHYERSLVDARSTGTPRVVLDALSATYAILTHPRDQARRRALAGEMLGVAEQTDDDDGCFTALHLYFALQVIDADPLLRTTFRRQEALARGLRAADRRWMVAYQRACLAYLEGHLERSLEIAEDAFATAPVAPARAISAYGMQLLLVRAAQGRGQEVADLVDAAIDDQPGLTGWRAVAAWLASSRGDRDRVAEELRILGDGASLAVDMTWGAATMILGRAAAATGLTASAEAITATLLPYSGQFTWFGAGTVGPYDLALGELALALGNAEAAAGFHASAQRSVTAIGATVFQPDLDALAEAIDGARSAHR